MLKALGLPEHWRKPLLGVVLVTLVSVAAFFETWSEIVAIWSRSDTFTHGFLVAPVSVWLIWSRRELYRDLRPAFSPLGLLFIIVSGFGWLIADLVHVAVIQQWAVVGVLVGGFWAVLGSHTVAQMLFPIVFLFLMVPFGEAFIPPLMEYTATFVVTLIRLTGMSVYREGLFFTLTSGNWSVVEGCSGLRYLISSLTLGSVYAYLNYSSYKKRTIFIALSFLVPILANGLRAYLIVMIGHFSNMKLAAGVDHIVYGWVFFGIVMFALFYFGSFWHDSDAGVAAASTPDLAGDSNLADAATIYKHYWPALTVTALCVFIWPFASQGLSALQAAHVEVPERFSSPSLPDWQPVAVPDWGWEPNFKGVVADAKVYLSDGQTIVGMYFANFGDETQGGELVNSQNYLVPQKHPIWRMLHDDVIAMQWAADKSGDIEEAVLNSTHRSLLVERWYRVGDKNTANAYLAKWWQLLKRLSGDASAELLVVMYTETPDGDYDLARQKLKQLAVACCD
ncbi:exosortase A [Methylomonas sp. EFPC1]|uniref:exosortase A n=1 Tax=Methylomonas sp. EFPC1 TaxID=2812647 RepID=UPI0019688E76|nr:exosortase A [Methylomonas sp. EFPC1]QSB02916.1 exosortase A [Methylomonas sp. EFPC1]